MRDEKEVAPKFDNRWKKRNFASQRHLLTKYLEIWRVLYQVDQMNCHTDHWKMVKKHWKMVEKTLKDGWIELTTHLTFLFNRILNEETKTEA